MKTATFSIILPAYNEAKRITTTLEHILAFIAEKSWDAEVIVVDDGSKDGTPAVVRAVMARHSNLFLIENAVNAGKGKSIRDGVLRATGEFVLFADADDSTPIADAEPLFAAIANGADIAMGSRWVDRSLQESPQPWYRRLNGRLYNLLLRSILGLSYKDTQNGFKAYSQSAAKAVFYPQRIQRWGFDAETLYLAKVFHLTVCEVPVRYTYYPEGSKIRPYRDGARMVMELLKVRWYAFTGAYPRAAFGAMPERSGDLADVPLRGDSSD